MPIKRLYIRVIRKKVNVFIYRLLRFWNSVSLLYPPIITIVMCGFTVSVLKYFGICSDQFDLFVHIKNVLPFCIYVYLLKFVSFIQLIRIHIHVPCNI